MDSGNFRSQVGHRIKVRRAELNLKQNELGEKAGLPRSQISACEQGRRLLRLDEAVAIASALSTTVGYLVGELDRESPWGSNPTPPLGTPDILRRIVRRKVEEVAERAAARPIEALRASHAQATPPRGFAAALAARVATGAPAVIAEIKRASPSKGLLREDFRPEWIALDYAAAGATCLSVLTDQDFFGGADADLGAARAACALPVLRKDFVVDPYQVHEARALGADCVLLILACLDDARLRELADLATCLGMDVLAEVHDDAELERALRLPGVLIGINNRDLRTFEVRIETTLELRARVPSERLLVTESGILTRAQVRLLRDQGVNAFLVGEAFMRAAHPGAALAELFAP